MPDIEKRIIGFTGAAGSGKSSLALNLALAWAGTQTRAVLIVTFSSSKKKKGSKRSVDPAVLLDKSPSDLGRPPVVSRFGVGVVSADGYTDPSAALGEMSRLNEAYDLFLDIDPKSAMKDAVLAACRRVFYLTLPGKTLDRTLPPHFELVVNRVRGGKDPARRPRSSALRQGGAPLRPRRAALDHRTSPIALDRGPAAAAGTGVSRESAILGSGASRLRAIEVRR